MDLGSTAEAPGQVRWQGLGDVAVGLEAEPAFVFMGSVFMSGPHAGEARSGGIFGEGREVSWDVLCRGLV